MPTGPSWPSLASHTSTKLPSTVSSWAARLGRMREPRHRGVRHAGRPSAGPEVPGEHALDDRPHRERGHRATDGAVEVAVLEPPGQHEVQRGAGDHAELSAAGDGRREAPGRDGHAHAALDHQRPQLGGCAAPDGQLTCGGSGRGGRGGGGRAGCGAGGSRHGLHLSKLRRRRLRNRRLAGRAAPRDQGPGAVPSSPRSWTVRPWGGLGIADRLGAAAGRPRRATAATPTMHVEGPVMTATVETSTSTHLEPWRAFTGDAWRAGIDVAGFIRANVTPYTGAADFLAGPTERTTQLWEGLEPLFAAERERGVLDVDADIAVHASPATRRATSTATTSSSSACRPTLRCGARSCRTAGCGWSRTGCRPTATSSTRPSTRSSRKYRKTHNDGRVRRLHPGDPRGPASAHIITGLPDAYGRGRIIGDYRRVRALRRRPADRGQEGREGDGSTTPARPTRSSATARSWPSRSGRWVSWSRWRRRTASTSPARRDRAGGGPVAVPRLPRGAPRSRTARRCRWAARPRSSTSTCSATSPRGGSPRSGRAGARRRLRHQAAPHPVPADPGVRRAVLRRPDLGHRDDRRDGMRRPPAGHPHLVPLPADPVQPRAGAGAEPDGALVARLCRAVQGVLRAGVDRHQLDPVRERRPAAHRRTATTPRSPAACRRCRSGK